MSRLCLKVKWTRAWEGNPEVWGMWKELNSRRRMNDPVGGTAARKMEKERKELNSRRRMNDPDGGTAAP